MFISKCFFKSCELRTFDGNFVKRPLYFSLLLVHTSHGNRKQTKLTLDDSFCRAKKLKKLNRKKSTTQPWNMSIKFNNYIVQYLDRLSLSLSLSLTLIYALSLSHTHIQKYTHKFSSFQLKAVLHTHFTPIPVGRIGILFFSLFLNFTLPLSHTPPQIHPGTCYINFTYP